MSFQALTWATEQTIPAMQKIVLLMMANRTNHETGMCYPSINLLATECGMSRRSLIDQISKLESAGLLVVLRSDNADGTKCNNQYRLNLHVSCKSIKESDSAGDALGGSAGDALGGSAGDALGGSAGDAPKPGIYKPEKGTPYGVPKKEGEKINGSRLAVESLPEAWRSFCEAERPRLNADWVFARFRDYWIAQPGAKSRKLDWSATWRNWVRNEIEGGSHATRQQSGEYRKLSLAERAQQDLERLEARERREREFGESVVG